MSYRAFKRLLGETSLERKCRFLFGAGILLLITASFWLYAYKTERLAYNQATPMGRMLVNWVVTRSHLSQRLKVKEWAWDRPPEERAEDGDEKTPPLGPREWKQLRLALEDLALDDQANEHLPEAARVYQHVIIKPKARSRINQPEDSFEADLLKEFLADRDKFEHSQELPAKQRIHYYGAVRATAKCLACHPRTAEEKEALGELKEGDLMALVDMLILTTAIRSFSASGGKLLWWHSRHFLLARTAP